MRRFLLLLLFPLLTGISLNAQNIVLNVGLNISNMSISYSEQTYTTDRYPIFSPDLMLNYEHYITKTISIKPGILYSRQGRLIAMDLGSGFYYEEKFTINYVDFPFLISYNFNPRSTWGYNLNLNVGPYVGYGFNGVVTSDNTAFVSEESLFLGGDGITRNDYGMLIMAGFGNPDNQLGLVMQIGIKNMALTGGDYTDFRKLSIGLNYIRFIDFGPNARRMLKKRFF